MKKMIVAGLVLAGLGSGCWATAPYFEGTGGLIQSGNMGGGTFGLRGGLERNAWDLSFGYLRAAANVNSDDLISDGVDLHTLTAEVYKIFPMGLFKAKAGGGLGYAIPNLSGGTSEQADNDAAFVLGGGAEYNLTPNWSVSGSVKGLFFRTDIARQVYGSHIETLNNGQSVEVLDVRHESNSINFNSVLIGFSLRCNF